MKRLKKMVAYSIGILVLLIIIAILFYKCYFLRQPEREMPKWDDIFLSPANGQIVAVINNPTENTILYKWDNEVLDNFVKWLWTGTTMVSIAMTLTNVHYQRSPNDAKLIDQEYVEWSHKAIKPKKLKWNPHSTIQNEYNSMLFEMDNGTRYRIIQIAWICARRVVSFLDIDESVEQWEIIWLIKFWSQVTIIFDNNVEVVAKVGDKVVDWETILARTKTEK